MTSHFKAIKSSFTYYFVIDSDDAEKTPWRMEEYRLTILDSTKGNSQVNIQTNAMFFFFFFKGCIKRNVMEQVMLLKLIENYFVITFTHFMRKLSLVAFPGINF